MSTETHEPAVAAEPAAGGRGAPPRRSNPWRRMVQYYREIISELRKVIWPGRHELVTYSVVVLVFVIVVTAIVASLDYGLTRAVLGIFG
jgi:preprotein translocase subunit SecE